MHIVHLYDGHEKVFNGRGSVPNVVWNIAKGTAAQGHQVTVLERQWDDTQQTAEHDNVVFRRVPLNTGPDNPWEDVPYELIRSPQGISRLIVDRTNFAFGALRHLRALAPDVIHVHLPFAANVLMMVAPWLRPRTIYTAHLGELRMNVLDDNQQQGKYDQPDITGSPDSGANQGSSQNQLDVPKILRLVSPDSFLAKRVAHTTVLNSDISRVFEQQGIPESKLSVIPNGVDYDRFNNASSKKVADVRDAYDLHDTPLLLFVGTIMPRKGVDDLIRAAVELQSEPGFEDLQVAIAGEDELDGEYTQEVKQLAKEQEVEEAVSFLGFVPDEDLPSLYALADVFVLPSREEGFGMTVTEAMAAGTPVIATNVGGVSRLVNNGEQGYLIEPNDPADIVMCTKKIISREEETKQWKKRTQAKAKEFAWSTVVSQFTTIYDNL